MKMKISIPEWHEMARAGKAPPMRILIQGNSMLPLIRRNRDYVTIMPLQEPPSVGDIVLFSDPRKERYVLHRLWRTEQDRAQTWGDNCPSPDEWLPWDAIWGKATLIERGSRGIRPDPRSGMLLARVWHVIIRSWRMTKRIGRRIKRRLKI